MRVYTTDWPQWSEWSDTHSWPSLGLKEVVVVSSVAIAFIYGLNKYRKHQTREKIKKKRDECERSKEELSERLKRVKIMRVYTTDWPQWSEWSDTHSWPSLGLKEVVVVSSVAIAFIYGLNKYKKHQTREKIKKKRDECERSKEELSERLKRVKRESPWENGITELSFEELKQKLKDGSLTPADVLHAFQKKASDVDQRLNCIIEPIVEAEAWAQKLKSVDKKGPLYGIPLSLKDSTPIQVLKNQGAIPFVITNAPQSLMSFACENPIFGRTRNPYNPKRIPGGSSGGEGSLIGGGGSILGVGTDLLGSIRVPSAFSGVCGLKPTVERLSFSGFNIPQHIEKSAVSPAIGPMGRDVESLVTLMKAVLVPELFDLDPTMPPMPFREEIYESRRSLRIGYYHDDGYYPAVPACHRAVNLAKTALEGQGHTLVHIDMPDVKYAMEKIGIPAVYNDGAKWSSDLLNLIEAVHTLSLPVVDNGWTISAIPHPCDPGLDAVICPSAACVAVPYGTLTRMGGFYSYTFIYNILNFPAGVVPVTRVNSDDTANMKNYKADTDGRRTLKKAMVGSEGLPVGVQCAGLPFQEELVLRIMKNIQDGLRQ